MIPISFARLGFGLEGRKALNPTQSQEQSVIKVGLKLLEQLKTIDAAPTPLGGRKQKHI